MITGRGPRLSLDGLRTYIFSQLSGSISSSNICPEKLRCEMSRIALDVSLAPGNLGSFNSVSHLALIFAAFMFHASGEVRGDASEVSGPVEDANPCGAS